MSQKPTVSVAHVGICTSNLEQSVKFYTEALGFEPAHAIAEIGAPFDKLMEMPGVTLGVNQLTCGGVKIELIEFHDTEVLGSTERRPMNQLGFTHMTLVVDDIDATAARIEQYGGKIHNETKIDSDYGPLFFCTDPNGVRLELMQMPG